MFMKLTDIFYVGIAPSRGSTYEVFNKNSFSMGRNIPGILYRSTADFSFFKPSIYIRYTYHKKSLPFEAESNRKDLSPRQSMR